MKRSSVVMDTNARMFMRGREREEVFSDIVFLLHISQIF